MNVGPQPANQHFQSSSKSLEFRLNGRLIGLLIGLLLALPIVALGQTTSEKATLRVLGLPDELNRFLFLDENGQVDGFDYRLLQSFAASEGLELEFVTVDPFEDLIPALVRGEGDIAAGSLTITDEREALVDFSAPYFPVMEWILANQSSPPLESLERLAGMTASTVAGTTFKTLLESLEGVNIVEVKTTKEMYEAVRSGAVDFTLDETVSALVVLPDYPEIKMVFEMPTRQSYGFAMAPGSALRPALDRFLDRTAQGESYYRLVLRFLGPAGVEALKRARTDN